jgi:hypothetical protein
MNGPATNSQPSYWRRATKIAAGIVVFGVLMGIRPISDQIWLRAVLAAVAASVLAWALLSATGRGD